MHGRFSFAGGKATKLSKYGSTSGERIRRAVVSATLCSANKLEYHLIDSEWKWHYLMPHEAQQLLDASPGLTTVLTFSSRHLNSLRIVRQTVQSLKTGEGLALNLVVGNKAYMTDREARRPPVRTLVDMVKFAKRNFSYVPTFIGTEGLTRKAVELAEQYDLVPMLLLDKTLEKSMKVIRDYSGMKRVALYVPYLVSSNYPRLLHDILYRLSGYILRRTWVQKEMRRLGYEPTLRTLGAVIQEKKPLSPRLMSSELGIFLKKAASTLTIYGTPDAVAERMRFLKNLGITTVFGFPIKENEQQIVTFGECVRKTNIS